MNIRPLSRALAALFLVLAPALARAGSATWNLNPVSGDWNTPANWTPATVPSQAPDVATFGVSQLTDISLSATVSLDSFVFTPGASEYAFDVTAGHAFFFFDAGVVNNSSVTQNFLVRRFGSTGFYDTASAGSDVVYTVEGSTTTETAPGSIFFNSSATAGAATITAEGGGRGGYTLGGQVNFNNTSTAGNATITCESGGDGNFGGMTAYVQFNQSATGGNATLIAKPSSDGGSFNASIVFKDTSNAQNATLVAEGGPGLAGGVIFFQNTASGGKARVQLSGGALQTHVITGPSLTIGSLEGDSGYVTLGTKTLYIGNNNLSTTFGGDISGTGSVVKNGRGALTLSGASDYSGTTTVTSGRLQVTNHTGSATGTGTVLVNGGGFGGQGIVTGATTVGTGSGRGASLTPGTRATGTLRIGGPLALMADATYVWTLNSGRSTATKTIANGVSITGATLSLTDMGGGSLPPGTVFTVISNSAATPIAGTFTNLADGAAVTVGSNTYKSNYEGGDGNDLTLTVQ